MNSTKKAIVGSRWSTMQDADALIAEVQELTSDDDSWTADAADSTASDVDNAYSAEQLAGVCELLICVSGEREEYPEFDGPKDQPIWNLYADGMGGDYWGGNEDDGAWCMELLGERLTYQGCLDLAQQLGLGGLRVLGYDGELGRQRNTDRLGENIMEVDDRFPWTCRLPGRRRPRRR